MTIHSNADDPTMERLPPELLYTRIRARVGTTPASTLRTHDKIVFALTAVLLLVTIVVLIASEWVYGGPAVGLDVAPQAVPHLVSALVLVVALTLFSTGMALFRGRSGLGPGALSLGLVAGFVAPIYAWLVLESPVHAYDAGQQIVEISPWGLRCLVIAGIVGAIALISFAAALRRAIPVSSTLRGTALGAVAGAWAGLAVFVFCPSSEMQHLLLGHVLPVGAFTVLGAALVPKRLRP